MKNYLKLSIALLLFSYINLFSQESNKDIFSIARSGSITDLKNILEEKPELIDQKNMAGYTPLILACYSGNNEVAKYIVDKSNNINLNNGYGTALMAAVVKGNKELVSYLLSKKADVNVYDANGTTALHYAVIFNLNPIAEELVNAGAKYDIKDNRGNTAKDYAVLKKNQKLLTLFKN
ncbi:ankyrin repeat domain-containing protein [Tenacibaculum jejuense]|uniref:Uncharacterized protein n=1 Tax=Tenacibaculum jejuense TaxID=584609 RepID=A0A238U8C8_9FLAO|nr:ankyrin repeat domain-containing protein [Tenacibaculum jejuense]SNR15441.1 conserved protein of unknown function [Tenacibaculum jejuense]